MKNKHIAEMIKKECKNKKISINSLLENCNLTKSFIYDLEKRNTSPSCEKVSKIADYLDCSVDYLLGRTDVPEVNRWHTIDTVSYEIAAEDESITRGAVKKKFETTL